MTQAFKTIVRRGIVVFGMSATSILPGLAQQRLNNQAYEAQQGMYNGALNQGQTMQIDQQIGAVQQQVQAERAAQGGQLTPFQQQTLQNQEHTIGQVMRNDAQQNGHNPQQLYQNNGMFPGGHHHHMWGNQNGYTQNGQYAQYGQYGQYSGQNAYQNNGVAYPMNGYSNGPNPYYPNGNPYQQPGMYGQQQQGGLSGATNMLKRLF
jgi:hypothetical protein